MAELKGQKRGLGAEITGIILLALSLLIGASLVFYHTGATNRVGIVGNNISWILFVTIGYTAYVFPLLFLFIAYRLLLKNGFRFRLALPASLILFVSSLSGMLSTSGVEGRSGGIVGDLVERHLGLYLGTAGSMIVLGAVFLISLRVGTGLSLVQLGERTFSLVLLVLRSAYRSGAFLAGKAAERRRAGKEAKAASAEERPAMEKRPRSGPTIVTAAPPKPKREKEPEPVQEKFEFASPGESFTLPPLSFLDTTSGRNESVDRETILTNSKILEKKLRDFDVHGNVVEVRPGPVVTTYEFEPAPGIKVGKITNLTDDLALAMRAASIRIMAPVPGKAVVGIEIPNQVRERILLGEIIGCPAYRESESLLTLALGKDSSGVPFVADLAKMPHLLVAGATGAGKSVSVNAMILSILYKATPDDARFLMIDPKMLELSVYEGIPHLLTPVVTSPKRAAVMLKGIVNEMERRYRLMAEKGARSIERYNAILEKEAKKRKDEGEEDGHRRLPYIVVVIDELADLMMSSGKDVEDSLVRLSQMARAAGIHLIVATQRPSVDVITGLIKTNFPARISFQVPSRTDSRTILDSTGAEALLGDGDMLFLPPGTSKLKRVHGVYVSEAEIKKVTDFLKKQSSPPHSKKEEIISPRTVKKMEEEEELGEEFLKRYKEAVEMAMGLEMISTSYIQRRFRIGYNTAARIIEKMEEEGIVGPSQGSRPREVLKRRVEE